MLAQQMYMHTKASAEPVSLEDILELVLQHMDLFRQNNVSGYHCAIIFWIAFLKILK
jgi:hypothetical protein